MSTAEMPAERLNRSDIPRFLGTLPDCRIVEVHELESLPQAVTFEMEPFRITLETSALLSHPHHDDLDRAWLWAGFTLDPSIDLAFVNDFNRKGHLACASVTDGGLELHDHFILAGIGKREAELILGHHILAFGREMREFNLARNERARSLSVN